MLRVHATSPVFWRSAATVPSIRPTNTSPWPRPTPGGFGMPNPALSRSPMLADSSLSGAASVGRHVHRGLPVFASTAYRREPAEMNITPSLTVGVALVDALASNFIVQAPPRFLTLSVVIRASVEYRALDQSPPKSAQSLPGGFRPSSPVCTATATGIRTTAAARASIRYERLGMSVGFYP